MDTITGTYEGEKHCKMSHTQSGTLLTTDAPIDNNGKGETYSPTDLVAAALGSCLMTIMAIYADKNSIDLSGSSFSVIKKMSAAPRKIAELEVELTLPVKLPLDIRTKLEAVAHECPVKKSLHPDVKMPITFLYKC